MDIGKIFWRHFLVAGDNSKFNYLKTCHQTLANSSTTFRAEKFWSRLLINISNTQFSTTDIIYVTHSLSTSHSNCMLMKLEQKIDKVHHHRWQVWFYANVLRVHQWIYFTRLFHLDLCRIEWLENIRQHFEFHPFSVKSFLCSFSPQSTPFWWFNGFIYLDGWEMHIMMREMSETAQRKYEFLIPFLCCVYPFHCVPCSASAQLYFCVSFFLITNKQTKRKWEKEKFFSLSLCRNKPRRLFFCCFSLSCWLFSRKAEDRWWFRVTKKKNNKTASSERLAISRENFWYEKSLIHVVKQVGKIFYSQKNYFDLLLIIYKCKMQQNVPIPVDGRNEKFPSGCNPAMATLSKILDSFFLLN